MHRVMFVCLGNICRSTMAEFVLKDMVKKRGIADKFIIESSGTFADTSGEPIHYGTKNKLREKEIPYTERIAVQLKKEDYEKYDYFLVMDDSNLKNVSLIFNGKDNKEKKVKKLLEYTNDRRNIADPWYTGDFEMTYDDILKGCTAFLDELLKNA